MKKDKVIIIFLCILLLIVVALYYQNNLHKEEADVVNNDKENETNTIIDTYETIPQDKIESNAIAQLIYSTDELYLESYVGSENLIYLSEDDKKEIEKDIVQMELKLDKDLIIEDQPFQFVLHLKNKNIEIYIGQASIFVQDNQGYAGYKTEETTTVELIDKLKQIYLKYLNKYLKSLKPDEIRVDALDIKQTYSAKESDLKDITVLINLKDIINNNQMTEIPVEYPYYQITFKTKSEDAVLTIVNDDVIFINLFGEDAYFKYNTKLKDEITNYFNEPLELDNFIELFEAKSIEIEDLNINWSMDKNRYDCLQVIRCLVNADKEKMDKIEKSQSIRAKLLLTFNDYQKYIMVYNDYIKYGKETYKSTSIGDKVTEILDVVTMESIPD